MRAKKDPKTGKWYIRFRYTDWQGKRRETMKRGFADFTEMYFKSISPRL